MTPLLQAMASGILMGALYALIASGFALILGAARVFNLAHGDLVILGAYIGYGLWTAHRLHPLLASPLAVLLLIPLAVTLRPLLARLKEPFELKALILCFGLSLFLQNVMRALFTSNYRLIMVPAFEEGIPLGPVRVARGRLLIAGLAIVLLAILHIVLSHTFLGKAMRAVVQDREAASLMGIDTGRVERYVLGLGGAMAGLAGPLFASLHYITPTAGFDITIIALILTLFGGIGRLPGLFLGGLLFGSAEALAVTFWGAQWKEPVSFLVLLLLLQRRAFGLLSGKAPPPAPLSLPLLMGEGGEGSGGKGYRGTRAAEKVERWGEGFLLIALLSLPFLLRFDDYFLYILTFGLLFAALSASWNLLASTGLISFGHAAFFGLGAYTSAIFSLEGGLSPWITILLGMGWASAFALLVGATCLHLRGPSFALGTLCWAEILKALAFNLTSLTQGAWGLVGIPPLPALSFGKLQIEFSSSRTAHYFLFLSLLVLLYFFQRKLWTSRWGIAMRAIREGEERASSLGINAFLLKLGVLSWSGGSTGLLGALYAHLLHTIEPGTAFSLYISFIPLIMAMFGGMHHPLGPIVGALFLYLLNELLFQPLLPWAHQVPYAIGILLALFFLPQGIMGQRIELRKGRAQAGP